jgi:hypothetical protein
MRIMDSIIAAGRTAVEVIASLMKMETASATTAFAWMRTGILFA